MNIFNDMPLGDWHAIDSVALDFNERNIVLNWQLAISVAKAVKFLSQFDCQIEVQVHRQCKCEVLQICGHPVSAIISSDDGTHYCAICAEKAP